MVVKWDFQGFFLYIPHMEEWICTRHVKKKRKSCGNAVKHSIGVHYPIIYFIISTMPCYFPDNFFLLMSSKFSTHFLTFDKIFYSMPWHYQLPTYHVSIIRFTSTFNITRAEPTRFALMTNFSQAKRLFQFDTFTF